MNTALEAGADDVVTYDDGEIDVFSSLKCESTDVSMISSTNVNVDADTASKLMRLMRLIDMLKDCYYDVQEVHHNGELSDKVVENTIMIFSQLVVNASSGAICNGANSRH